MAYGQMVKVKKKKNLVLKQQKVFSIPWREISWRCEFNKQKMPVAALKGQTVKNLRKTLKYICSEITMLRSLAFSLALHHP